MGEKECYLCKQMGHYKKDCTDKENASKTFANREKIVGSATKIC